jgi:hypothetical protein
MAIMMTVSTYNKCGISLVIAICASPVIVAAFCMGPIVGFVLLAMVTFFVWLTAWKFEMYTGDLGGKHRLVKVSWRNIPFYPM